MSGVNSPVRLIRVVDRNGTEEGEKGGGAGAPQGDKETANNLYNRVLSESKAPPPLSMLGIKKNSKTSPAFLTEKCGGSQLLRNSKSDTSLIFGEKPYRVFEVALAETIGTGMLMFFGCMGLVSGFAGKQLPSMQGGLIFGFVVSTIICIFGHISTAHLNPAVTAASVVLGNTTPFMAVVYLLSECIGACLGFGLLKFITPSDIFDFGVDPAVGLCSTVPHPSLTHSWQAFMGEFLATSFLIFLVCSVWDARNADKSDSVALKFALTIAAISIAEGPYTGASMNPARTLAPAIFNNVWTMHWVYWVAPISSGIITAFIYKHIFNRKRRTSMDEPIQSIDDINAEVPLTGVISSKHPSIEKIQDSPLTKRKANNS